MRQFASHRAYFRSVVAIYQFSSVVEDTWRAIRLKLRVDKFNDARSYFSTTNESGIIYNKAIPALFQGLHIIYDNKGAIQIIKSLCYAQEEESLMVGHTLQPDRRTELDQDTDKAYS